jgi:hypothetical protein
MFNYDKIDDVWFFTILTIIWGLMLARQLWTEEAWTYGPPYPKKTHPKAYWFFIILFTWVFIIILINTIKVWFE